MSDVYLIKDNKKEFKLNSLWLTIKLNLDHFLVQECSITNNYKITLIGTEYDYHFYVNSGKIENNWFVGKLPADKRHKLYIFNKSKNKIHYNEFYVDKLAKKLIKKIEETKNEQN